MDSVLLAARIVLALVFAAAAAGKLLDLRGSRAAMGEFGLPARAAAVAGTLLPLAELAVAVALVPPATARWAAIGALVLLVAFIGGIAGALLRGRAPDCHCFGQLHSAPAGRGALARNALLAALAAVVVGRGPGPTVSAWVSARSTGELIAVAAGALAALALLAISRGAGARRLEGELVDELFTADAGLAVGTPAPGFALEDTAGGTRSLDDLRASGQPVLLMFLDPGCGPCKTLLADLGRWQAALSGALTMAVITRRASGGEDEDPLDGRAGIGNVLLQKRSKVSNAYRVAGTPSAVVVSPAGAIASATVAGGPTIEALIRVSLQREAAQPQSPTHAPA
jgi:uncharacterized membrane protein YphA (DoxX/SURF4 family)/thiol-disulfide isomerase/thioredoxin